MRLIDADKLYPDRMTNKGNVAISQSQIAKAPTVNAVSEEVYTREYNLRKDAEFKVYKLEKAIDEIKAEIETKCDRINSLASVLPYTAHREIQELLCEIMDLCKESEDKE